MNQTSNSATTTAATRRPGRASGTGGKSTRGAPSSGMGVAVEFNVAAPYWNSAGEARSGLNDHFEISL